MSVALHAILAVAVLRGRSGAISALPPGVPEPPVKPVARAAPEPVEIELWSPLPRAAAVGPVGEPGQRIATRDPIRDSRAVTAAPASPPANRPAPTGSLAMRAAVDLKIHTLHERRPAAVEAPPPKPFAPLPQPATPDSGEPDPRATHEGFSLHTAPDGSAHLEDTRNLRFAIEPTPYRDSDRPIEHPIGAIGATVMKFDVTDWMMRSHGDDPYASAKLAQLDATRDERAQIGARHRHVELDHAGELMQRNLEQLWATVADPAERKRELFALWDECSETGSTDVVEASAHARTRVVKFVRTHLPAGTPEAFTAAELAALDRDKQSHASFRPYAGGIE
jgi:hypothetical protein